MNIWVLIYRFAWMVVVVSCAVALVFIFLPKTHSYQTLQKRKDKLTQENARIEGMVREYQSKKRRFLSDPQYVERVAREQGMAKPGETVFRFPATNAVPRGVRP